MMERTLPQAESYVEAPKKGFVAGVEVEFPTKPYPSQYGTMNMVIRGLRNMTNTLIECPTGSGKTLSLICSTLAWQKAEAARLSDIIKKEAEEEAARQREEQRQAAMQMEVSNQVMKLQKEREENNRRRKDYTLKDCAIVYDSDSEEDMDDFQTRPKKITKMMDDECCQKMISTSAPGPDMSVPTNGPVSQDDSLSFYDSIMGPTIEKPKVAKIFYCSRTHQQLQQVVRELRKTAYKDVKMTILSSREHTCIHSQQKGSKIRSKTELCRTLLDIEGPGCMFNSNIGRMATHEALEENCMLQSPWDLDDLVRAGRRVKACPYFSARELVATADIVFCPYIYLIDPKILSSMRLDLRGSVILLDEAHNIEDCCRDASSISLSYNELEEAVKDCHRVVKLGVLPAVHNRLASFLTDLMSWMSQKISVMCNYSSEREMLAANTFGGVTAVASLEEHRINLENITMFKNLAMQAIAETNKDENREQTKKSFQRFGIAPSTVFLLEGLYLVLGFMYNNNMEHVRDYYVALSKTPVLSTGIVKELPEEWMSSAANEMGHENRGYYINFLCMNPGVIFRPIADVARSIVLASGTLSPILTFSSELNTTFTNELQAPHIVAPTQVWVGMLGCGPRGRELNAGYRFTEQPEFRQELGYSILNICRVIPFGVLCFLPSYGLLENLRQHWMRTGLWAELEKEKDVFCESRSTRDHPNTVQSFTESVNRCEMGCGNGPLLFAVMRGKVSEGMDFANNRARGVITVGIPYPHVYDIQVSLKRKYNDANIRQGLKSGNQWYETQAYRALNQALGRCIRHKNDWGALIIIESRFLSERKHTEGLSKWIRDKVQRFDRYDKFDASLREFIRFHKPEMPQSSDV